MSTDVEASAALNKAADRPIRGPHPSIALGADSAILLFRLGATLSPRCLRAWSMRIPLACCLFLAFLLFIYFSFLIFFPFFDFDLDIVYVTLSFSCGYYAVSSVSVSAATRLAYDMYLDTLIRTYTDLTFCFLSGAVGCPHEHGAPIPYLGMIL